MERKAARPEGRTEYLWDAARLEALTVYLGPVEKITSKGPKAHQYYFASWKDGFRSSKYAYLRDGLVKAELVRGNSPRTRVAYTDSHVFRFLHKTETCD